MKFNGYQEEAILSKLAIVFPGMDSTGLWYSHLQPFFIDREFTPSGAVHLANSSEELAYELRLLAVDYVLRKVASYAKTVEEQQHIISNLPLEALHQVAQMMGEAITAAMMAIRDTPVYG